MVWAQVSCYLHSLIWPHGPPWCAFAPFLIKLPECSPCITQAVSTGFARVQRGFCMVSATLRKCIPKVRCSSYSLAAPRKQCFKQLILSPCAARYSLSSAVRACGSSSPLRPCNALQHMVARSRCLEADPEAVVGRTCIKLLAAHCSNAASEECMV